MDLKAIWEMSVKKNLLGNDARIILISATLVFFLAFGIGVSFWGGAQLKASAHEVWLVKGKDDAARMTETVLFWLSKTKVNLRAIAGQFRGRDTLDADSFLDLVENAGTWDPDVTFGGVAYVQRVLREDRPAFEASQGKPLTVVGRPREKAPESFESFAVRLSSRAEGVLRLNADLLTHPAMRETIITARQASGEIILSPAFKDEDGNWNVFLATAIDFSTSAGILAATINLEDLFSNLLTEYLPPEMQIRLAKLDGGGGGKPVFIPIIGSLEPPEGIAATESIKISVGLARWILHWDILPGYLGGPAEAAAGFVRFGGSALTLLVTAVFGFLSFQNVRFHRLVQERTAELARNAMIIQLTMDSIDQGFVVWDADQHLVVWSKACVEFWYEPENLIHGMHMKDLLVHIASKGVFGEGDPEKLAAAELKRISAAGTDSEETFILIDGRNIHVRRFPLEKGGHVGVYTDITAQEEAINELKQARDEMERRVRERTRELTDEITKSKEAEEALRESEERIRLILANAVDAIISIDERCIIESFNAAAETVFGYSEEEVLGKNINMLMPQPYRDEHDGYLASYLRTGEAKIIGIGREVEGLRKDGTIFPMDLGVSQLRLGDKTLFIGSIRDITERKLAEAQVIQAAKLATLGEMATSVAHELNQPLNVIRMAAGNVLRKLKKGVADPAYLNDKLGRIASQTERAAAIIDHMRMFGRKAKEKPAELDLCETMRNALDLIGEQLRLAEIDVSIDLPETCPPVMGHPVQMEQVVLNLLTNARDAIRENTADGGGKITLAFDDGGADMVRITVSDTGGGIPEKALGRIFEPFYTTKEMGEGTGLGLSVSYGIIRDMGGTIKAENVGGGAIFTITLPVAEKDAEKGTSDAT